MRKTILAVGVLLLASIGLLEDAAARDLSFEQRVQAGAAIERVYHAHRIGEARAFEEAVPRSVLEANVRKYLAQSVALEERWNTPVTAEMLEREVERMARDTRMPERLQELFAALGHDGFLVQECLARASLVERLTRHFLAGKRRKPRSTRRTSSRSPRATPCCRPWRALWAGRPVPPTTRGVTAPARPIREFATRPSGREAR